jgi:hypothetical protein
MGGGSAVTGPEHYREAERLIALVDKFTELEKNKSVPLMQAQAQVHATLSLAAATALSHRDDDERMVGMHESDWLAWDKVAGVSPLEVRDGD